MSGGLVYNFRQGNRSELLADYLLSAVGITTPVRRQDDYGFDFYCQLSDQESGYLTFGYPYIIQIKSDNLTEIKYGVEDFTKWKPENVTWLFRNEIPFFVGVVNKEKISIEIYDTTGLWQVYNKESLNYCTIELKPSKHMDGEMRQNCQENKVQWEDRQEYCTQYIVDLGNPIIDITYEDLQNPESLKEKKGILRIIIALEQINIIHRNLGIRAFNEIKMNLTNSETFITGMAFNPRQFDDISKIYSSLQTALISLLVNLKSKERYDECISLKEFLKYLPRANYYEQLYNQDSGLFDWIHELKSK